jgi:hypothetical protein
MRYDPRVGAAPRFRENLHQWRSIGSLRRPHKHVRTPTQHHRTPFIAAMMTGSECSEFHANVAYKCSNGALKLYLSNRKARDVCPGLSVVINVSKP